MFRKLWSIYYEGLSHLPKWAKIVLAIVVLKLLIMFIVFKMILMPNYLNSHYSTDEEKSECIFEELTNKNVVL